MHAGAAADQREMAELSIRHHALNFHYFVLVIPTNTLLLKVNLPKCAQNSHESSPGETLSTNVSKLSTACFLLRSKRGLTLYSLLLKHLMEVHILDFLFSFRRVSLRFFVECLNDLADFIH
jgi:hypothetical protein